MHITIPVQFMITAVAIDGRIRGDWDGGPGEYIDPVTQETVSVDGFMESWDRLASGASEVWNQAFRELRYRGCYELRLETVLNFVPGLAEGDSEDEETLNVLQFARGGTHHIWLYDRPFMIATRFGDGVLGPPDTTVDTVDPYRRTQFGQLGHLNPYEFAHELGHLMGLGDDYTRTLQDGELVVEPKPGRNGTFMSDDYASANIDQELVDRIGDLASQFVELPRCLYARFEWHFRTPQHRGTGRIDVAEISLGLGENGALEGEGTHNISGEAWIDLHDCTDHQTWEGFSTFPVVGRREGDHVAIDCQSHITQIEVGSTGCTIGGPHTHTQPAPVPVCALEADLVDGRFESEDTTVWGAGPAKMVTRILIEERGAEAPE